MQRKSDDFPCKAKLIFEEIEALYSFFVVVAVVAVASKKKERRKERKNERNKAGYTALLSR